MVNFLLAFVVGGILGLAFALLKLPIPAPPSIEGVFGILGITVSYLLVSNLLS